MKFGEGERRGTVDRHEQAQLAFGCSYLGDVDVEQLIGDGLNVLLLGPSPSTSGNRGMPWRDTQRCSDERVRCAIVAWRASRQPSNCWPSLFRALRPG
jgi:hypothetical protein